MSEKELWKWLRGWRDRLRNASRRQLNAEIYAALDELEDMLFLHDCEAAANSSIRKLDQEAGRCY